VPVAVPLQAKPEPDVVDVAPADQHDAGLAGDGVGLEDVAGIDGLAAEGGADLLVVAFAFGGRHGGGADQERNEQTGHG